MPDRHTQTGKTTWCQCMDQQNRGIVLSSWPYFGYMKSCFLFFVESVFRFSFQRSPASLISGLTRKTDVIFPLLTSFCVCLCTRSAYKAQSSMCSFCPDYCYSHSHLWSLALKRSQICQSSSLVPTWHRQCTVFMLIVSLLLLMLLIFYGCCYLMYSFICWS